MDFPFFGKLRRLKTTCCDKPRIQITQTNKERKKNSIKKMDEQFGTDGKTKIQKPRITHNS